MVDHVTESLDFFWTCVLSAALDVALGIHPIVSTDSEEKETRRAEDERKLNILERIHEQPVPLWSHSGPDNVDHCMADPTSLLPHWERSDLSDKVELALIL